MRLFVYPPVAVSVTTPPTAFILDGVSTTVSQDTVTPANSTPLPVIQLDSSGNPASPLTDAQLRATPVPVSGPLTDAELRATPVQISGTVSTGLAQPLTDVQLRATAVPVSGPLTDAELRASAVPVSAASLPLPAGASTLAEQQAQSTLIGAVNETAPGTDTASSGLNGRLQRIAQRITDLIALLPTSLGQKTMANSFAVTLASDQSALSVTQTALTPTFQEITNLTISAHTFTAPAGAKWCKVYAPDTNSVNVRIKLGGTATITSGIQLQPGRSEDFAVAGNISVIAESSTNQQVNVTFGA